MLQNICDSRMMMGVDLARNNVIKTAMIFLLWMTKGLYLEASGPAMIDLKLIYKTNFEAVTRSVAGRGVGGFLGAVIGGILVDKYESTLDLFVAIGSTISGAAILLVPAMSDIKQVWILYCILGCCGSVLNIAATRMMLKIWKDRSNTALQIVHMGFGAGALAAPLLCSPYLAVVESIVSIDPNKSLQYRTIKESKVQVAFTMIAVFTVSISVPFFLAQLSRWKLEKSSYKSMEEDHPSNKDNSKKTFREIINPATYANGNFSFGTSMLILLAVFYFNLVGGEKVFASFVRTYSIDVYKMSKTESSYLNTVFWLSFTLGRLIISFVANYIPVKTLFLIQVFLNLGSVTLLNNFSTYSSKAFWLLTSVEGFVISPLYGYGITYGNSQISVTGICLMTIVFAQSIGDLLYLWTAGWMYDQYGPQSVLHCLSVAAWAMVVCVVAFRIVGHCFSSSNKKSITTVKVNV